MTQRAVSVLIPVYNAFSDALECLLSVLRYSPEAHRVLVIDDASPEGEFFKYLPFYVRAHSNLMVIRNEENLGFVKTCNKGMKILESDDVVLLNSDTIVTPFWLSKLHSAAYSRSDVGTVTPLTNNGIICSFPGFCLDNRLPEGFNLNEFAALVEEASAYQYPELPTAVGFCMYIKRELINKIGVFDEVFGAGYGEENDFSCRAKKAGYRNILDDSTYIYHKGSMSFKEQNIALRERNSKLLAEKHPEYYKEVSEFCSAFPLMLVHARILDKMVVNFSKTKEGSVLHILHNGPFEKINCELGGTEQHVQDIIRHCSKYLHWSLVPKGEDFFLTAHLPGEIHRRYTLKRSGPCGLNLISKPFFSLIHLHHINGYIYHELYNILKESRRYIFSVHDFTTVCPRNFLYSKRGSVCNGFECVDVCGYTPNHIYEYRKLASLLYRNAKKIIVFSNSTKAKLFSLLKDEEIDSTEKISVIKHGVCNLGKRENFISAREKEKIKPQNTSIKVAFVGHIPPHKGGDIAEKLLHVKALSNGVSIEWQVIGVIYSSEGDDICDQYAHHPNIYFMGEYNRDSLLTLLQKASPKVAVFPSKAFETYFFVVDECWNAGIPVIVSPFGAGAERVRQTGAGWILPSVTAESVLWTLERFVCCDGEYEKVLQAVEEVRDRKLIPVEEEIERLTVIYDSLKEKSSNIDDLVKGICGYASFQKTEFKRFD